MEPIGLTRRAEAKASAIDLKGKKLEFIIPEGTHTFYDHVNPDGTVIPVVHVYPGDVVDAERVLRAAEFVERGQAKLID